MLFVSPRIQIPLSELDMSFSRSSGKGGQNVNKVSTKALLKWSPSRSESLSEDILERFLKTYQKKINQEGEVVIQSDRFRSQSQNENDCYEKLATMIRAIEAPPKKRKKTKPSFSQKKKRLEEKNKLSEKKKNRKKDFF